MSTASETPFVAVVFTTVTNRDGFPSHDRREPMRGEASHRESLERVYIRDRVVTLARARAREWSLILFSLVRARGVRARESERTYVRIPKIRHIKRR